MALLTKRSSNIEISLERKASPNDSPKLTKKLSPPDILPEDLSTKRNFGLGRKSEPRRRSQLNREEIQIEAS